MIRIIIADDQLLFAESLKAVIEETQSDIKVVAIAHDGNEAIKATDVHNPSLILMDVRMPRLDGVGATRLIHARLPHIPIIMLTTFEDDEYVREALKCGAKGYLLKNIPCKELISSMRAVLGGMVLFDPRVIKALMPDKSNAKEGPSDVGTSPAWYEGLNRREKQILSLICQGFHNNEISNSLFLASQTVRNSISKLYQKMNCSNRNEAITLCKESGIS